MRPLRLRLIRRTIIILIIVVCFISLLPIDEQAGHLKSRQARGLQREAGGTSLRKSRTEPPATGGEDGLAT